MKSTNKGILISYSIGLPLGLLTIAFFVILPALLTGEGITYLVLGNLIGKPLLGLILSFVIILGIAGKNVVLDILNNNSILNVSAIYSITVNAVIWSTFTVVSYFTNKEFNFLFILIPIIAFIICSLITTFTIGLLICKTIENKIKSEKKHS